MAFHFDLNAGWRSKTKYNVDFRALKKPDGNKGQEAIRGTDPVDIFDCETHCFGRVLVHNVIEDNLQ